MFQYLKFMSFHVMGIIAIICISMGDIYIGAGFAFWLLFYVLGDMVLGDDTDEPKFKFPALLTVQLWLALPLLAMIFFVAVWQFAEVDVFGYGAFFTQLTGYDALAARDQNSLLQLLLLVPFVGLATGLIGTLTGHELTHRTWDPVSMFIGRWLLSFSFDVAFAIEHVYGHHRYVSTKHDPATAPRGRNVYAHLFISTIRANIACWEIEKSRLNKKGQGLFSYHNAAIRGYLMSVVLVVLAYLMAGVTGAVFLIVTSIFGKFVLEVVNFMEHYGMVRNPDVPVQPRHSWNTNKRLSSWTMFNLTRHSHHHAQGEVPYHELKSYQDAPMMIGGYLTTMLVALVPPLWNKLMVPKVLAWDQNYATQEELMLANEANRNSGIPAFEKVQYKASNT